MPSDPTPADNNRTGADRLSPTVARAAATASAQAARPADIAGRYELGELLGEGGMGRVYAARDTVLNRRVAVKVLREEIAGPEAEARFRAEARITGQLQHPGVPPVHDLGTLAAGRPFLVMKLIKGRTLADELGERPAPPPEFPRLLQAFEQVCQTVAFAHSRDVIHRDLKPQNVMVGAFGEVQVMDWGLAKVVPGHAVAVPEPPDRAETTGASEIDSGRNGDGNSDTRAGAVVGTPAYMPPEQARGEPVDRRADVFALGGILCAILTGQPPYTGTRVEVRAKAELGQVAEAVERLNASGAPAELVALVVRCLAPRAADRPGDAGAVASAVAAFRAAAEARARRAETDRARAEAQAVELRKRRRVQLALFAAVALLALGGGAFAWWQDRAAQAERQRDAEADAEQARVEGELKATQARADADRRVREAAARAQVPDLLKLATELRKAYRFKEARAAVEQARATATGLSDLEATTGSAARDLDLVVELDAIRLSKLTARTGSADTDKRCARASALLAAHGIDVRAPAVEVAERVRASAVKDALIDALDLWGLEESDPDTRARVWEVTARATGHDWRRELAAARDAPKSVNALVARVPADEFPPALHAHLGFFQYMTGGGDGVGFLHRGLFRYPTDFWHHTYLAMVAALSPQRGPEVLGHVQAALAIRPDEPLLWYLASVGYQLRGDAVAVREAQARVFRLAPGFKVPPLVDLVATNDPKERLARLRALAEDNANPAPIFGMIALGHLELGELVEAEAACLKALDGDPLLNAATLGRIGAAWLAKGDRAAGERCFRAVVRAAPGLPAGYAGVGFLARYRDWAEALEMFRQVVNREPLNGLARAYYAEALAQNQFREAEAEADIAVRLLSDQPQPLVARGVALVAANRSAEALDVFRDVARRFPNFAEGHAWVCYTAADLWLTDEALRHGRRAVQLDAESTGLKNPIIRYTLGRAHLVTGDPDRGLELLREAVAADPSNAITQYELARGLLSNGRVADARAEADRARALMAKRPRPSPAGEQLVAECERVTRAERRLPDVLAGRGAKPDVNELYDLALICQNYLRRYPDAVSLYRRAFASNPALTHPNLRNRYYAARTALLAATGHSAAPVPPNECAEFRAAAFDWLQSELRAVATAVRDDVQHARAFARTNLPVWLNDPMWGAVRHPLRLAALPPGEAARWQALWNDVRALRDETAASGFAPW